MFTDNFLNDLADMIAGRVIARLERHAEQKSGLSEWLDKYGELMTRDEVATALKVTKRHVINLEQRGKLVRVDVPGKEVKYHTAKIFSIVNSKKKYAAK